AAGGERRDEARAGAGGERARASERAGEGRAAAPRGPEEDDAGEEEGRRREDTEARGPVRYVKLANGARARHPVGRASVERPRVLGDRRGGRGDVHAAGDCDGAGERGVGGGDCAGGSDGGSDGV